MNIVYIDEWLNFFYSVAASINEYAFSDKTFNFCNTKGKFFFIFPFPFPFPFKRTILTDTINRRANAFFPSNVRGQKTQKNTTELSNILG